MNYENFINKQVEVAWNEKGPWYPKYLVAYLPDAQRPFFCVASLKKGYNPSAWDYCREVEEK